VVSASKKSVEYNINYIIFFFMTEGLNCSCVCIGVCVCVCLCGCEVVYLCVLFV